jgi:hypothetical protein
MSNQDLVVNRWKRYGKDRLYVMRADGSRVGFWDLVAGEARPGDTEDLGLLVVAVEGWLAANPAVGSGTPPASSPVVEAPEPEVEHEVEVEVEVEATPAPTVLAERVAVPTTVPEDTATPDCASVDATARPWVDLSANRAGASARQRAVEKRGAAPVKSTLARVLGVHTDERAWRIGADGEELVAAQLTKAAKKDPRWNFLHAIPVGDRGSDIDHLIIGPGGVFTVNTKHHPKAKIWVGGNTFMVNGHKQRYVRDSRYEAARAAKLLTAACGFPVHVEGLIVTVNASEIVVKSQPDGVSVTWRNNVPTWLLSLGDILTPDVVSSIYEASRRSTTWRT